MKPRTFYDKIWADHLVDEQPDGTCLLYIDRHIVHEVTSPQAFEGLRLSGRKVHAPDKTLVVVDHNVPTSDRKLPNPDPESAAQIAYLAENAKLFGLEYYDEFDIRQGICHVIGPEQGFTLPGTTLVCGDSHTATHGAFGALAYGIGTSEVEHVLATQTLVQTKSKNMRAVVDGKLPPNVTAKDIILAIIGEIGTAGGTGYSLEYAGEAIRSLSMEGRMTVCNMSVEAGAKAGFIAPDEKAYEYREGPPQGAEGQAVGRRAPLLGHAADRRRRVLRPRGEARRGKAAADRDHGAPARSRSPRSPARCRCPSDIPDENKRRAAERSLQYMGLTGGEKMTDIKLNRVFIGSCTNSRIEDLREVARIADGKKVNANVYAMIVPGSGLVKEQAEQEGLDKIFKAAGFDWREPGCSMCLAMNPDKLAAGRALRLDLEPQLRGPAGLQGPHASGVAGDGGGGGDRRPFRRRARLALSDDATSNRRPASRRAFFVSSDREAAAPCRGRRANPRPACNRNTNCRRSRSGSRPSDSFSGSDSFSAAWLERTLPSRCCERLACRRAALTSIRSALRTPSWPRSAAMTEPGIVAQAISAKPVTESLNMGRSSGVRLRAKPKHVAIKVAIRASPDKAFTAGTTDPAAVA